MSRGCLLFQKIKIFKALVWKHILKMVFLIFVQDIFEVRFPLFSSFFTIFAIFAVWKLYVYSKKKSRVKELENYVKYLHWHRLENIKRIKYTLKVTKEQIEHITGKVDLILDSLWTFFIYGRNCYIWPDHMRRPF